MLTFKEVSDCFEKFLENPSHIQKEILQQWYERMTSYYHLENESEKKLHDSLKDRFFKRSLLSLFYPEMFLWESPFCIPNIQKAIYIIQKIYSHNNNTRIVLYADKDADGLTSLCILYLFFRDELKLQNLIALVPEEEDSYGITDTVANRILEQNPELLITLDCGSSNAETLHKIKQEKDIPIIVIDHHFIPHKQEDYPNVDAFINPKICTESFQYGQEMCTSLICLKFIWAITFAFTKEYNLVNKVPDKDQYYYIQNGILIKEEEIKDNKIRDIHVNKKDISIADESSQNILYYDDLLKEACAKNEYFTKFYTYLNALNANFLTFPEKFQIVLNMHYSNIFNKVSSYLPLASIGTVADIMPLVGDNRIILKRGLDMLSNQQHNLKTGFSSFLQMLHFKGQNVSEQDLSFYICPHINAPGRLGKPEVVFHCLIEEDPLKALKYAFEIKKFNENRKLYSKRASKKISDHILKNIYTGSEKENPLLVIYDEESHRGISGLIANKIAEEFKKPTMILVNDGDCIRGSIRAFKNENVYKVLEIFQDNFIQFGGHRQAAGFSLEYHHLESFIAKINKFIQENDLGPIFYEEGKQSLETENFLPKIELTDKEINLQAWYDIRLFSPFGKLNPHPIFTLKAEKSFKVVNFGASKEHIRINFAGIIYKNISAIWFFTPKNENLKLKEASSSNSQNYSFLVEPQINYYKGNIQHNLKILGLV